LRRIHEAEDPARAATGKELKEHSGVFEPSHLLKTCSNWERIESTTATCLRLVSLSRAATGKELKASLTAISGSSAILLLQLGKN
jgi:hypothetical protein